MFPQISHLGNLTQSHILKVSEKQGLWKVIGRVLIERVNLCLSYWNDGYMEWVCKGSERLWQLAHTHSLQRLHQDGALIRGHPVL